MSAERFTQVIENPEDLINSNKFYLRILLATAGSIGEGLDLRDVYSVCQAGFLTIIFKMAQKIGRYGREGTNKIGIVTNNFYLILSYDDFIYLNIRLFQPPTPIPRSSTSILSTEQERELQQHNLLLLLKMIVLKGKCWHVQLESLLGNPLEPLANNLVPCGVSCPK